MREATHVRNVNAKVLGQLAADRKVQSVRVGGLDCVIQSPLDGEARSRIWIRIREAARWRRGEIRGGAILLELRERIETC